MPKWAKDTCQKQRLFVIVTLGLIMPMPRVLAADAADKLTGLPLHPGLTFQQNVDSPVCGKRAQIALYDPPDKAALSEFVGWYKERLKAFHYVHKVWSNRAQEMLYSLDGSKGVSITGKPTGPGVFAVTYMQFSAHLTTHQMDAFDPSNPSCK